MLKQIIKFCFTGGLCTVIDFGVLFILTEQIGLSYIVANIISVSLSTIINYILSKAIVFNFSNTLKNFIVFVVLSIIGLAINEGLIILCVNVFMIDYKIGKVLATGVVMCFNYLTRKYILKEK